MNQNIKEKLSNLKELPGCYLMKNEHGEVIYVGKAKKLVNRVSSYFLGTHSGKTAKLVSEIEDFDTIITNSDKEAFLLEINLIHQYNPIYNILLKDGKSYPYIELHLDKYPYLTIARNIKNKNSKYYGPYTDSSSAYETLNLLNRLYPLRKCIHIPTKPCLYYHISECLGPCINKIDSNVYKEYVDKINSFLNGNTSGVYKEYKEKMKKASEELNFESANEYKKILEAIDHISLKQYIMLDSKLNCDVFAFHIQDDYISISTLVYRNGILKIKNNQISQVVGDTYDYISSYILEYYEHNILPNEIIMPYSNDKEIIEEILNVKVNCPTKGTKYNLLTTSAINAKEQMQEKYMLSKSKDEERNKAIKDLEDIIGISNIHTIELIDNAHFNGDNSVSGVVVFTDGKPNKKLYRKYNINTLNTKDDLLSMKDIIYRRYYRKIVEHDTFSDLLIVDGGINQINAVKDVLDSLCVNIPLIGLAKNDKHNTDSIVLIDGSKVNIKDNKNLFFLLSKMQDEVHRFTISFHKSKRSTKMVKSILDDIQGLGIKRREKILDVYKDIETLSKCGVEELTTYVPKDVAIRIVDRLNKEDSYGK